MRLATWNIEWMNALFDDDGEPLDDDGPSARYRVTRREQLVGIGIVLAAIDADAVFIVEAPDDNRRRSTVRALETLAEVCGLRTRRAIMGYRSDTEQELALLYDPDRMSVAVDPQQSDRAPRFDGDASIDLGNGNGAELIRFARPPLELAVTPVNGTPFRLIGAHAKSKAPHGARTKADVWRLGLANRRKQLAQCIWLRKRIEAHLTAGDDLIVMGDLNDGPGIDSFEGVFGISGVEIVMGCAEMAGCSISGPMRLHDPHAMEALRRPMGGGPSSARFYSKETERYFSALLDYILVSPSLAARRPKWRIWHPFDDPVCWKTPELRQALLAASDHFPVTLDLPS